MAISKKVLREVFDGIAGKLKDPEGSLKKVRESLVLFDKGVIHSMEALENIDKALEGFGIEVIKHPTEYDVFLAEYVNTGDTYNATIVFSYRTRRFYATSWGDWYENSPEYKKYSLAEYKKHNKEVDAG